MQRIRLASLSIRRKLKEHDSIFEVNLGSFFCSLLKDESHLITSSTCAQRKKVCSGKDLNEIIMLFSVGETSKIGG